MNLEESGGSTEYRAPIDEAVPQVKSDLPKRESGSSIVQRQLDPLQYEIERKASLVRKEFGNIEPSVYFDYDDFEIKEEYENVINAASNLMLSKEQYKILIEGHSDERGTTEYNLALGQKRAEAVAKVLEISGVPRGKMELISFGEERPSQLGSDEESWSKNRRVDLILR